MPSRVLVLDDKEEILRLFARVLGAEHEVKTATDGGRGLELLASGEFDLVVTDVRMPGADGMRVLAEVKRSTPDTEVIVITAYGSVEMAVEAMRAGAYDYLAKPLDPDRLEMVVRRALERRRLKVQARSLQTRLKDRFGFHRLVGGSAAMREVYELAEKAARVDVTVLIAGDSGTGKDLLARAIHQESRRAPAPYVAINCGAIPGDILESELFGHVRGAFTGAHADRGGAFEEANGGTLFLDEVAELPFPLQVKLNRALQERVVRKVGEDRERPVDLRVIAATNRDLAAQVRQGLFREDLFYRLKVFEITMPPLRARREDIPALAAHFVALHTGRMKRKPVPRPTPRFLSALHAHAWPGNVRELESAIERSIVVTEGDRLEVESLPPEVRNPEGAGVPAESPVGLPASRTYREAIQQAVDAASRAYLAELMRRHKGNVSRAASHAGVKRETLHRLLKRSRLDPDGFREDR